MVNIDWLLKELKVSYGIKNTVIMSLAANTFYVNVHRYHMYRIADGHLFIQKMYIADSQLNTSLQQYSYSRTVYVANVRLLLSGTLCR